MLCVIVFMLTLVTIYRKLYMPVGPNEVLIISGGPGQYFLDKSGERRHLGFRIVIGGGTLVNPILERVGRLSLGLVPVELNLGDSITVRAQVKIRSDQQSLITAAEIFLDKGTDDIGKVVSEFIANR